MRLQKETFSKDLISSFPEFFSDGVDDFAINCREGWYPIILVLCYQLRESMRFSGTCILDEHPKFLQIEEKFSHLRIHITNLNEMQSLLVQTAEELACFYCEFCGKTTDTESRSLNQCYKTICLDCYGDVYES